MGGRGVGGDDGRPEGDGTRAWERAWESAKRRQRKGLRLLNNFNDLRWSPPPPNVAAASTNSIVRGALHQHDALDQASDRERSATPAWLPDCTCASVFLSRSAGSDTGILRHKGGHDIG